MEKENINSRGNLQREHENLMETCVILIEKPKWAEIFNEMEWTLWKLSVIVTLNS